MMHSVTLDSSGSPKKRPFSRGISEDESLRSIIKEAESSARRLTRSDSRAGTLKRRTDSQSEQDLFMGLPEMLELQTSYEEAVQELRGLEIERETLLFQVDVLQDTLEGVEELLAEAQREARQATLELEQERGAKRKLDGIVHSLMQEVERLKEEQSDKPDASANLTNEATGQNSQTENDSKQVAQRAAVDGGRQDEGSQDTGSVLVKLRKMANKPLGHSPSLALDNLASEDGVLRRPCENGTEDGRAPSPADSDGTSAYEDASAETPETPEQHRMFAGDGEAFDLPRDSENEEKSPTNNHKANGGETLDSKNPDACVLS